MNDEFVDYILQLIVNTSGLGGCSALSAWKTSSPSLASEPRAAQGPPRAFYARSCGAVLAFGKLGTKNQQLSWRRFRKLNGCNEAGHSFALLGLDSCSISARDCPLDCILSLSLPRGWRLHWRSLHQDCTTTNRLQQMASGSNTLRCPVASGITLGHQNDRAVQLSSDLRAHFEALHSPIAFGVERIR